MPIKWKTSRAALLAFTALSLQAGQPFAMPISGVAAHTPSNGAPLAVNGPQSAQIILAQACAEGQDPADCKPRKKRQADEAGQGGAEQGGAEQDGGGKREKRRQAEEAGQGGAEQDGGGKREKRRQAEEAAPDAGEQAPVKRQKAQPADDAAPAQSEAAPDQKPRKPKREAAPDQSEEQPKAKEKKMPAADQQAEPQARPADQKPDRPKKRPADAEQPEGQTTRPADADQPEGKARPQAEAPSTDAPAPARKPQADETRQAKPDANADAAPEGKRKPAPAAESDATPEAQQDGKRRPDRNSDAAQPEQSETVRPPKGGDQPDATRQVLPGDDATKAGTELRGAKTDSAEDDQPRPPRRKDTADDRARKEKNAEDPAATDDTVVLPVEDGAPVLDSDKRRFKRGDAQNAEAQEDELRQKRRQVDRRPPPKSDAEAQVIEDDNRPIRNIDEERGERLSERPRYDDSWEDRDSRRVDNRLIIEFGGNTIVRHDDNQRFERFGRAPIYDELPNGRVRETVTKRNGDQIVSIRNRYGELVQRSRIDRDGREVVLFFSPELYYAEDNRRPVYRDPADDLPPMVLPIPVNQYIIDTTTDPDRDYYEFLEQPPVERVERVYSLDEVRNSARVRDKMRRIDLDTITFATGSSEIPMNKAGTLKKVADAINEVLEKDPAETFLIEGHTDAVGSADSNLVLSDQRAEAVADVLTQVYNIPPENMVTQGYGEQFLKVDTDGPAQENRRVTIRRVTPLVRPVASNN